MKTLVISFVAMLTLAGLSGCNSDKTPGEAAGQAAYEVEKGAKKAAKEISKDVKTFSHDAKEGFKDAKQKDLERKKAREAESK